MLEIECRSTPPDVELCIDWRELGGMYVYLLGLYLGDGYLTLAPRNVWRLRIFLDQRYEEIVRRCEEAIHEVSGRFAGRARKIGCVDVYSNWKHWVCLFPQHGPGPKHRRSMALESWQAQLVTVYPGELIRGLIHSDGCRAINRITHRRRGAIRTYEYPRYLFSNRSQEIRDLFIDTCAAIDVDARLNNWFSVSVAKRASVAILEDLVGPKR